MKYVTSAPIHVVLNDRSIRAHRPAPGRRERVAQRAAAADVRAHRQRRRRLRRRRLRAAPRHQQIVRYERK